MSIGKGGAAWRGVGVACLLLARLGCSPALREAPGRACVRVCCSDGMAWPAG